MIRRETTTTYQFDEFETVVRRGNKTIAIASYLEVKREETLPVYDPEDDPVYIEHRFGGQKCKSDGTIDKRYGGEPRIWFPKASDEYAAVVTELCKLNADAPFRTELIQYFRHQEFLAVEREEKEIKELLDSVK